MINKCLLDHIAVVNKMEEFIPLIQTAGNMVVDVLMNNGKILLFGNGGSAADSQHIAAELSGRFKRERKGLPAIALTTDSSVLTSVGNDYSFEQIFSRQVEALCNSNDLVVCISTSGNSENVINGAIMAKKIGAKVITLTGKNGGGLAKLGDVNITIPSNDTPRIQEMHIMVGHFICAIIDDEF